MTNGGTTSFERAIDARAAVAVAVAALGLARDDWATIPSHEVTAAFGALLRLRASAEGAALALLLEASSRGVIAASENPRDVEWIRATAQEAGTPLSAAVATQFRDAAAQAALTEPDMGALRASVTRGDVPVTVAARMRRDLELITARVPAPVAGTAVSALVEYAATGASHRELSATREAIIATYGDEGTFEERQAFAHTHREMTTWSRDAYDRNVCTLALDNAGRAIVDAAMNALAAPMPTRDDDGHIVEADARTATQRRADAFIELCHVVATDPSLLSNDHRFGAVKGQLMLTMSLGDLQQKLGYALDEHGQPLPPSVVRRLCCDVEVIPAVLGTRSEVLDLGYSARTASPGQRRALVRRDQGCTFPGCSRAASWCDAHHLIHWVDGGKTNVANLALLCSYHHARVHQFGYTGCLGSDGRVRWLRAGDAQSQVLATPDPGLPAKSGCSAPQGSGREQPTQTGGLGSSTPEGSDREQPTQTSGPGSSTLEELGRGRPTQNAYKPPTARTNLSPARSLLPMGNREPPGRTDPLKAHERSNPADLTA